MQYQNRTQKDKRWINEDTKDEVIYSEKVDGPFVCCNIQEFSEIMQNIKSKTASRE